MLSNIFNLFLSSIFLTATAFSFLPINEPVNLIELPENQQFINIPEKIENYNDVGVEIIAESYIVVEPLSGAVLIEKNSNQIRSIASITKLMTALVFLDAKVDWDSEITMILSDFTNDAVPVLMAGDRVKVKDLFYAMLISSSNESTNALVRSTGLSREEFVLKMNLFAKLLGMKNSQFVDPVGLSSYNKSTAEEVIKLLSVAFSHSEIRKASALVSFEIKPANNNSVRRFLATNRILNNEFGDEKGLVVKMGKTGFINSAGFCFASLAEAEDQRQLLSVVLNSSSNLERFNDTKSLLYWTFNNYKW